MKIIITEGQFKRLHNISINEMIKLDIKVGDTLLGGKFKNKKIVVKTIEKNKKGDITINGKPLLRFRTITESTINDIYDEFLTLQFGHLTKFENLKQKMRFGHNDYPDSKFWKDEEGTVMFELDSIKRLWTSRNVWQIFADFFGKDYLLDYDEITEIIQEWVYKHLNLKDADVRMAHHRDWERWQNLY